jgi:hypothetical protein
VYEALSYSEHELKRKDEERDRGRGVEKRGGGGVE